MGGPESKVTLARLEQLENTLSPRVLNELGKVTDAKLFEAKAEDPIETKLLGRVSVAIRQFSNAEAPIDVTVEGKTRTVMAQSAKPDTCATPSGMVRGSDGAVTA